MLEPCKRCFYAIMANYNGSLRAVDCYSHSVRYDMVLECSWQMPKKDLISHSVRTIWPSSEELSAISDASSGHLQRCSDADMSNKCLSRCKDASILSWPTIMGHYELWIAIVTV
eukprot:scaffold14239_cov89-Skeletonema_dohrnii-CCMP3373.AAC.1